VAAYIAVAASNVILYGVSAADVGVIHIDVACFGFIFHLLLVELLL